MTFPESSPIHTITLYQNKRIAIGEQQTCSLAEFLATPRRVACEEKAIGRAKDSLPLWSPGTFANNHRSIKTVESLFALGFDADEEPVVTFDVALAKLSSFAGHLTTSFRHHISAPRLRIVLILSRLVSADEYRRLWIATESKLSAMGIGIGSAAKDPSRGWFVPSTPNLPGYEYRHAVLTGATIDVDAELAAADAIEERALEPEHHARKAPKAVLERARLYVETWDPAIQGSGGSNNAFSHIERLVRGFDLTDDDALIAIAGWNQRCKPPWSKKELLHKIRDGREKGDTIWGELRDVAPIRSDIPYYRVSSPDQEPITLTLDKSRNPAKIAKNVAEILDNDPMWRGGPVFDNLSMLTLWPMPLPEPLIKHRRMSREIVKADYGVIQAYCWEKHSCHVGLESSEIGVQISISRKRYDSLTEHVKSIPAWDRQKRLRTWTSKYLGCPDDEYHQYAGAAWLASAMHRAIAPGDVVDAIPILIGKQKAGKNRAVETLFAGGPISAPFLAPLGSWRPDHADTKRLACSRWVLHDDEFSARDERTVDSLKSWASRSVEQWTPKYSNDVVAFMRRAVLVVSVNHPDVLKDPTGARRFLPLHVGDVDVDGLASARDQLLAEALTLHTKWRECMPATALHENATMDATVEDGLETAIMRLEDWPDHGLSTYELGLRCGMRSTDLDRKGSTRLGIAARKAGCVSLRVGPARTTMYLRPRLR